MSETSPGPHKVTITEHGPLLLRGSIVVDDADNNRLQEGPKAAICRCGGSENSPFCDGSHRRVDFSDVGEVKIELEADTSATGPLCVKILRGGPAILVGPHVIADSTSKEHPVQSRSPMCRCGASNNKPFCDGSHVAAEFES